MHNLAKSYNYVLAQFLPATGFEGKNRLVSLIFSPQKNIKYLPGEKKAKKESFFGRDNQGR